MSTPYQRGVIAGKKKMIKKISMVFQNLIEVVLMEEGFIPEPNPLTKKDINKIFKERVKKK